MTGVLIRRLGHPHTRREDHVKAWREVSHLLTPWSQTSSFQDCEKVSFSCLSHPACSTLLWHSELIQWLNLVHLGQEFTDMLRPGRIRAVVGAVWEAQGRRHCQEGQAATAHGPGSSPEVRSPVRSATSAVRIGILVFFHGCV